MGSNLQETEPVDPSDPDRLVNFANTFQDIKIGHDFKPNPLWSAEQLHIVKSTREGQVNVEPGPVDTGALSVRNNVVDVRREQFMCPADRYSNSCRGVTISTKKDVLLHLQKLFHGTKGYVIDEGLIPKGEKYEENDNFCKQSKIGKGSFGEVFLCVDTHSQKRFVTKKIKKECFHKNEVYVLLHLEHQNIVQVYGVIQRDDIDGQLVFEIMLEDAGVSLTHFMIMDKNFLPQRQIWDLSKQAFCALQYLDEHGIIHLDIKPDNICIKTQDKSLLLKLVDFGSAFFQQEPLQFHGMTPEYMSPELCMKYLIELHGAKTLLGMLNKWEVTGKVDSYACGLVIAFMYRRCHLVNVQMATSDQKSYTGIEPDSKKRKYNSLIVLIATQPGLLEFLIPKECDVDMHELLTRLTKYDHPERWNAAQALTYIHDREQRIEKQLSAMDTKKYPVRNRKHDRHSQPYKTEKVGKAHGRKGMKLVVGKTKCRDSLPDVMSPSDVISLQKIPDRCNMQHIQESSMKLHHVEFMSAERNNSVMGNVRMDHAVPKTLGPLQEVQEGGRTEFKQLKDDKKLWEPSGLCMIGCQRHAQPSSYDTQMVPSDIVTVSDSNTRYRQLQNCQPVHSQQQPSYRTVQEIQAKLHLGKKEQAGQKTLNSVKEKIMRNMAKRRVTPGVTATPTGPKMIMSQGSTGKMNTAHKSLYGGLASNQKAMSPWCYDLQILPVMDKHSPVQRQGNALDHSSYVGDRVTDCMSVDLTQQEEQIGNLPFFDQF